VTCFGTLFVLAPQSLGTKKYGGILSISRLTEFPEIGPLGRYGADDRAPFPALYQALRVRLDHSLFGSGEPWSTSFRDWVEKTSSWNSSELTEIIVLVAVGLWSWRARHRNESRRLLLLPIAVIVGYWLSCRYAPYLFLPQRYVAYTVPLMTVILVATSVGQMAECLLFRKTPVRQCITAMLCASFLLLVGGRGTRTGGLGTRLHPKDSVMQAIHSLPPGALVAAWPNGLANDIPYVAHRKVLVSNETHQAFHVGYTLEMRRRVNALIDAYSATNVDPLIRLYREFGVSHLLVQGEYVDGTSPRYFRPFDKAIEQARRRLDGKVPVTQRLETGASVFRRGNVAILSLARIAEDRETP
jgi:hypothetical protein